MEQPCNPAVGGSAKSQLVHEVDALGGEIGKVAYSSTMGRAERVAKASFNSQNPGIVTITNAMFGQHRAIDVEVLAKAFQLNKETVEWLQSKKWVDNSGEEDYILCSPSDYITNY
ncbi:germin-like protein 2-1 [Canna indica]|uniref:Germin-like protein 2-1 n=1 Tax=Canna indica TaxID=4628 RepID=A0AAQ3QLM2_9LILI|nr:germin-like protein 2-1 [Canna indica]